MTTTAVAFKESSSFYYESDQTACAQGSLKTYQITNINTWVNDSIDNSNTVRWYWLNATSGQSFTVFWDELTNSNGKTADIEVYVYKQAIETCTNDWGAIPASITYAGAKYETNGFTVGTNFTANETAKIYIFVTGLRSVLYELYKFGTYAIKVSAN
ncbi:MAG: hypothetical protein HZC28_15335 [Spirochaetes bacterium]|nr:hypothetical protein [Spirochaetota bacterium]